MNPKTETDVSAEPVVVPEALLQYIENMYFGTARQRSQNINYIKNHREQALEMIDANLCIWIMNCNMELEVHSEEPVIINDVTGFPEKILEYLEESIKRFE